MQEAKRYESEDRRRKELIEARNTADQLIYQTEKVLRELDGKVPESDRATIQQTIEDLKRAKDGEEASRIRQLTEQLQQASYAIGQQAYAQQAEAQQGAGPQAGGYGPGPESSDSGPAGDDFVDGDFREV